MPQKKFEESQGIAWPTVKKSGAGANGWVYRNDHWENCLDTLLFYYALLTGHEAVDYGYRRDAYSK